MNLFNLFAKITLDNRDYEKKIDESKKSASSFSSKVGTAFKTGARAVTAFATTVVAGAAALAGLAVKMVNFGSEIDDNSQKLGMSTEGYQYWSLVLQRAGTDASQLSMAIRQMTEFTTQLSEGNGDALLSLQKLGIGYKDFMSLSTEDQLYAIVTALQGVESQTDKVQLAQDIFGTRVYQELLPLLGMEQGSLEDLKGEFEGLGLIIADDTIKQTAALGDKFDNLTNTIKVSAFAIATELLPEIELITEGLMGLATGSDDAMQSLTDGLVGLIDKVATALPTIIETAGDLLIKIIVGLADVLSNPNVIKALIDVIEKLLFKVVEILPTLTKSLLDIAVALIDGLLNLDWGTLILNLIDALIEIVLVQLPTAIYDVLNSVLDKLINLFTTQEGLQSLLEFGKSLAQGLINGLISGVEAGVNNVISVINTILSGISEVWSWAGIPEIPDIPTISIPRVSFFAKGGMFDKLMNGTGTAFAIGGEDGAEIAHTGSRGTGIANVEQIADAQYMAMNEYGLKEAIRIASENIVNGIVSGLGFSEKSNFSIVVKIGDREIKNYLIETINGSLKEKGRKSLNLVTAY